MLDDEPAGCVGVVEVVGGNSWVEGLKGDCWVGCGAAFCPNILKDDVDENGEADGFDLFA